METGKSALELYHKYNDDIRYNAYRFLLKSIPKSYLQMGSGIKPGKNWITLSNWKKVLTKIIKFEEVYIYKKEKRYYYLTYNN